MHYTLKWYYFREVKDVKDKAKAKAAKKALAKTGTVVVPKIQKSAAASGRPGTSR